MIKSISLLTRKPGMTHEQFMTHWVETHAPLAHAVPGLRRYALAGLLLGVAIALREELYAMVAAGLVALAWVERRQRIAAGLAGALQGALAVGRRV